MPTNDLHRRLAALRGRLRRLILVAGLSRVVLVLLAALAAALLLDWSSRLETPGRVILLAVTVAMVVHTLWRHLLVPLRLRLGQDEMALLVERRFPELRDRLISTVQLARAGASTALSTALIGELEHETLAQASGMDFHAVVSPRKPLLFAAAAAGTLLLAGLFTGAFPETASIFSARFFNPFSLVEWPRATKLSLEATDSHGHPLPVEDGDHILMPKGEDLVLRVRAAGRKGRIWSAPAKVVVHYAFDAGGSGRRNVPQGDDAVYPTTFPTVIEAFTFHVEGGDDATQSYHVTVRNRPRIENVRVTLRAPAYTGEPDRVQDDGRGAIVGLAGAAATVEITTSKPVAATVGSARLIIDDGKPLPMAFVGDDPTRLTGSFVLAAGQRRYAIEVVDTEDLLNAPPASYRLDVRADRVPTVKLPSPGRNKKVTARATVPVHVLAEDDYAVRRLRFVHRQGEKAKPVAHALPDPTGDAKKLERRHAWDLSPLGLKEQDSLLVHAEAEDAYTAAVDGGKTLGPNVGRSPAYTLTVVSEAEMASILREKQQELKQRLRKVIERQDKSKSEVDRLAAEAAKETADRRKVGVAERGQRRIATTTENVAAELDTVLDEMRNNKVGNLGEQQRVETLAKTLRQTADKDMPEAARHIARAAQTDEKTQQQKLLADASAKQQDVLDTLRSALARFDQWHDIDELLKMANELLIQQKKLNTRTAELGRALIGKPVDKLTPTEKGTARSLARAQQAARDAMHSLETRMAEVAKALGRNDPAAAKLVEQALSQAISDQIRRKMDDAATRIEGARPATARQLQADATAALERLIKTLSRATSPYLARDLRKLQEDVGRQLKAIEKLLADEKKQLAETAVANLRRGIQALKKKQTDTRDKTARSATPDELKKQAPDQNQHAEQADTLSRDAQRSSELAEKTKAPLEQAGKELDAASKEMDKARTDLADAKKDPAQAAQDKAIKHLDKADADLADLQKALAQGKAEKPRLGERAKKQGETAKETEKASAEIQKSSDKAEKIAPATAKTLEQAQKNAEQASKAMAKAEQQLGKAGEQQDGGPEQQDQAQQDQQKAVDDLEQAKEDLAQAQKELDMQRRQQEIFELEKLLAALLPKQMAIRESTVKIDKQTDGSLKPLTHAQTLATRGLAARQGSLRKEATEIVTRLTGGGVPVFLYTMHEAESGMAESQRLLGDKQVDWSTQEEQRQVERKLLQLIEALKEEAARIAKGEAPPPPQGGGQGPPRPAPLVPPLAQLKQLKALQTEINTGTRTVEIDKTTGRRVRKVLLERRAQRLHKRQADLGKLTDDFAKALEKAAEDAKMDKK